MSKIENSDLVRERWSTYLIAFIIAGLLVLGSTSCATQKKCDGSKGVKTNMGTM